MGNILNKIGLLLNMPDNVIRCLGIISIDKKDGNDQNIKEHILNEHSDYDIVDKNEIYPYTFSKQNK